MAKTQFICLFSVNIKTNQTTGYYLMFLKRGGWFLNKIYIPVKVVNGILIAYWELVAYFEAVEEGEADTVTKFDANEILSLLKVK